MPRREWGGQERRSFLSVSGPWGLHVVLVSSVAIIWLLVGVVIAGGGACVWMAR